MGVRLSITNLAEVLSDIDTYGNKAEEAVRGAVYEAGLLIEGQAKRNASGRPGPNVRTGNLRASITTYSMPKGFGTYTAEVRATMVYARAVEFGHPRWKPGVKYPYLGPAARKLSSDGSLNREFTLALAARLRGG